MTGDPQFDPGDDADAELSSLFATMREDEAPADVEARLLSALAATSVVAATATAAKLGFWSKLTVLLNTYGVASSAIVGGLCGVLVCGVYAAVDVRSSTGNENAAPVAASAIAPATQPARRSHEKAPEAAESASAAPVALGVQAPVASGRPAAPPAAGAQSAIVDDEAAPPSEPSPMPSPALADAGAPGSAIEGAGHKPDASREDVLRQELLLVRTIAALIDARRCGEARAVIARYGLEHKNGQLAGEVAVLATRCHLR